MCHGQNWGPAGSKIEKHLEDAYGMPYFLGIPPRLKPIFGVVREASVTSMRSSGFQMPNMIMLHQFRPVSDADAGGPLPQLDCTGEIHRPFWHSHPTIPATQLIDSADRCVSKEGSLARWGIAEPRLVTGGEQKWDSNLGIQQ
jgi:hypothetical protein